MFYEMNTFDPLGTTPWKRSTSESINGTFDGAIDALAQITLFVDPSATLAEKDKIQGNTLTGFNVPAQANSDKKVADTTNKGIIEIPNILPDG